MPDGTFIDAPTYRAARAQFDAAIRAQQAPVVPVPVVVAPVTIQGTATPVDNFAGRDNGRVRRVGVGEVVNLAFLTTPPGQTAASFGGLVWSIKLGVGVLAQAGNSGVATLTCGSTVGPLTLELRTAAGVLKATKAFTVVAPTGGNMVIQAGTESHTRGTAGAGFVADMYLRPTDVSFSRVEFREGASTHVATGSFRGVFSTTVGGGTDSFGMRHPVRGTWGSVLGGDSVNGCQVYLEDSVDSGSLAGPPFAAGTFTWDIAWLYRVIGSTTEFEFVKARHLATVTATGQMTISKMGASLTKALADPTIP
jgi:hypothetical protein